MNRAQDDTLKLRWFGRRDPDAFAEIVARHARMVFATCRRILGNPVDAEDVTQECFLRLATHTTAPPGHLGGWLHRMAMYRALDQLRQSGRQARREHAYAALSPASIDPEWNDIEPLIDDAIEALPEDLRLLVITHFLEGASYSALSERTGLSRSTVARRVQDGVDRIRIHLRKNGLQLSGALFLEPLQEACQAPLPASLSTSLGKLAIGGGLHAPAIPTALIGGLLVSKKLGAGAALVLIGIGAFLGVTSFRQHATPPPEQTHIAVAATPPPSPTSPTPAKPAERPEQSPMPPATAPDGFARTLFEALTNRAQLRAPETLQSVRFSELPPDNGSRYFLLAVELLPEFDRDWLARIFDEIQNNGWKDAPRLLKLLDECRPAMENVRKGVEFGNASLPLARGPDEPLPYLQSYRDLARLMVLDAQRAAASGDEAGAMATYVTALAFGAQSAHGATVIGRLVGDAVEGISAKALAGTLMTTSLTPEELLALAADIDAVRAAQQTMSETARIESESLIAWTNKNFSDPQALYDNITLPDMGLSDEAARQIQKLSPEQLHSLMVDFLDEYAALGALLETPYYARGNFDTATQGNLMAEHLLPDALNLAIAEARSMAVLDSLQMSIALEAYKRRTGAYPAEIAALAPDYLANVPPDPFTGEPYHYVVGNSAYRLYSVGPDQTDNGGDGGSNLRKDGTDFVLVDGFDTRIRY